MKDKIPTKFYKGEDRPVATTVEELIEILKELPPELPVDQGFNNKGTVVIVFNVDSEPFVEFVGIASSDDDDW